MSKNYAEVLAEREFLDIGIGLFESEDLTNSLISMYLSLMCNGWIGASATSAINMDFIGNIYLHGLWVSCIPRVCISGQVDSRNDEVPKLASIPIKTGEGFDFVSVQQVKHLPRGYAAIPYSERLFWSGITVGESKERLVRRKEMQPLMVDGTYFSLMNDRILPTKCRYRSNGDRMAQGAQYVAGALQTVSDMKSMWCVETNEYAMGNDVILTPIRLGVDSEIVKSLFYSRQAPTTESGRRRPILHWVRSHQRRLADGIDVDIEKHLRGITEFEMDGFPFRITQPTKKTEDL
jgi:hypothetical protein